jgi:undecaprenyl diphosphate synthase
MSQQPTPGTIPIHLGLILDGNRRWAHEHGVSSLEGHHQGYENLKNIADEAFESGVQVVSAYIFSTENWNRSAKEVSYLMDLVLKLFKHDLKRLYKKGIKVVWLGMPDRVKPTILKAITEAERHTADNHRGTLALCFNYGGQAEIVDAVKRLMQRGIDTARLTVQEFEQELYHPDIPPVDLIIRTSGEHRLSNFMLWRSAYSELIFVDKHWPAFTPADLADALQEFSRRQRRFGA